MSDTYEIIDVPARQARMVEVVNAAAPAWIMWLSRLASRSGELAVLSVSIDPPSARLSKPAKMKRH